MERYRVVFRISSKEDLASIYSYVVDRSKNAATARGYLRRIRDRCVKIGDAPFGGVAREDLAPGIRMAVFEKSVVILYTIEAETVWITNIFSGGRDYEALLKA
jgi:toxin ParE1/3/4